MNISKRSFLALILTFAMVFGSSCKKDEEKNVNFLGTYNVVESCGLGGDDNYQITIVEGDAEDEIVIENFYNFPVAEVKANTIGNEIDIALQSFNSAVTFEGSGSLSDDILTITFTVEEGGLTDNCTIVATKP